MSGRDDGGNERQATNNNDEQIEIDGASSFLSHTPSRSHLA